MKARLLEPSELYGDLDGENNYHCATVFAEVHATLSPTGLVVAGSQSILEDAAGQLGFAGSGALEVCSDRPLTVSSRTHNQVEGTGTFGQDYPAFEPGQGLAAGQSAFSRSLSRARRTAATSGSSTPARRRRASPSGRTAATAPC